ncbi:MAG: hypothetical protein E7099_01235 [Mediterranea massiliensis]|nr:hypothetical protein [Mediterranea massiliensis]
MKKAIYIFLLSFLYTSCINHSPNSIIESFKDRVEYVEEESSISTDEMRKVYLMHSYDDILIMGNIHYDNFISFIDNEKGKLLGEYASRGIGPNEFIHLGNISVIGNNISLWDTGKSSVSLAKINDDNSLSDFHHTKIESDSMLTAAFQVIPINHNKFIAAGIVKQNRYALLNEKGEVINTFGQYPKGYDTQNSDSENGFIYQGELIFNDKKEVLVSACGMGEIISFYKITEKREPLLIKEYAFEHPIYQKTNDSNQAVAFKFDNIMGFIDIKMSTKYCICLYSGERRTDPYGYGGNKILLFDWDGNPIKMYSLNNSYTNIAIDQINNRIILLGTDSNTGDYKLSEINIPL